MPILLSGGSPWGSKHSEAEQMQEVLERDFMLNASWVESAANNTADNARYSFAILQPVNKTNIYLVTHARHMQRAAQRFRQAGFTVIEAPTAFTTDYKTTALSFLPSADALQESRDFFYEIIGLSWYFVKSGFNEIVKNQ